MRAFDPKLPRYARASRAYIGVSVALGVGTALLLVAQASLLASLISAVFVSGSGLAGARDALIWLGVVTVTRAGLAWLQEVAAHRGAQAVQAQLRRGLLAQVARLGPGWLTGERSGELATLATRGVGALDSYLSRYVPQLVLCVAAPVIVLAWILPADLIAGATIVLTLPLIPVFMVLVGLDVQRRTERQLDLLARLAHHFLDVVAGLATLKIFGREKAQARAIAEVAARHRRASTATLRLAFLSSLVLEFVATISMALVAVGIGLRLVSGSLDLRTALLVLILAPEAYLPLRQLGADFHASAEGLSAAARVFAVLETPLPPRGRLLALPDPATSLLCWNDVTVRYSGRTSPALAGFGLTVAPGQVVALTGPSGAGKSTAFAVALGFVTPDAGRVTVVPAGIEPGGAVGVDEADPRAWLSMIGWVPQRPYLVAGSVEQNVRLGDQDVGRDAVRDALRRAEAESVVDALPEGIATLIGAGGRSLSAGQRQRIALARAFLRQPPILLLDEPTASLDPDTEAAVVAALRRFAAGRIVVVIAHRPALLNMADRVVEVAPRASQPPAPRTDPDSAADRERTADPDSAAGRERTAP
ncbi:MAG: thiol reductant ABC exporter subunit CydD [Frankia sp.]